MTHVGLEAVLILTIFQVVQLFHSLLCAVDARKCIVVKVIRITLVEHSPDKRISYVCRKSTDFHLADRPRLGAYVWAHIRSNRCPRGYHRLGHGG